MIALNMEQQEDILELLRKESAAVLKHTQRALIVQPGAIGDCILTLPLAGFLKKTLGLGSIDMLGHTEYIGILPERSCIDRVISIDSVDLHRLFVTPDKFDLANRDPLINVFADYPWIITFMGEVGSDFEQNLIFTANCSHGSDVITLPFRAPSNCENHLSAYYIKQFIEQSLLDLTFDNLDSKGRLISARTSDKKTGRELLNSIGLSSGRPIVIIQPGSGGVKKSWCLDNFLDVSRELEKNGFSVLFLLGPVEMDRFDKKNIKHIRSSAAHICDLPLTQVVGLLSCANAYIGNDSGITHLAAGLGIKTISLFGPTNPSIYGPIGPDVTILKGSSRTFSKKKTPVLQKKVLKVLAM